MTSRLTIAATAFAVLTTASLAFAATPRQESANAPAVNATAPTRVVQLERVVITAKRLAS